jgi:hypothetical protein
LVDGEAHRGLAGLVQHVAGVAIGGGGDGEAVGARMREEEGRAEGSVAAVLG